MRRFTLLNNLLGLGVFTISCLVYLLTLEPTASFWDSGEFIATAYKLEIPHPPGAPLYLLFGRLVALFAPEPTLVAKYINGLSAVASAGAVMFLFWSIVMIGLKLKKQESANNQLTSILAGLIGSLTFAFTASFWYSATEAEVYGLSTFFMALILWAILKWDRLQDPVEEKKWVILIAFITGLSVGVHLLNLLAIPTIGLIVYFKKSKRQSRKGTLIALGLSALALLVVMYGLVTIASVGKYFELLMVNGLGLPFGTGVLVLVLFIIASIILVIYYSHKRKFVWLNTVSLGFLFVLIGYSSYATILIRANVGPPINQNDPKDILGLIYYLNMEQYPKRPLLYGEYFTSQLQRYENDGVVYEQGADKYEIKEDKIKKIFKPNEQTILPRMWSTLNPNHPVAYREIMGLKYGEIPSFSDNLVYMVKHQMGHMYFRYFLWNFAGKASSMDNAGWLRPWDYFENVPEILATDKARNNYFMLPLILGMIGMIFMFRANMQMFWSIGLLFLMTGFVLVLYLNGPPTEPRERDYIYVGSYLAFSVWIGIGFLGVVAIWEKIWSQRRVAVNVATFICLLTIPILVLSTNWDDNNRSKRYFSAESARNTLASCEPNAILFTGGDNDTYPLWYVQEVEGFRQDVRVIVLSYANVDWYINPMYEQINESAPLPLTLDAKNYKQGGLNDYVLVAENPTLEKGIDLHKYLGLLKKEHKLVKTSTSNGEISVLPSRKVILNTDSSKILKSGAVPMVYESFVSDRISFEVNGRVLQKRDLLILDMLDTNRWERPIYFNSTSLSQVALDFENHVIQVGDVMRLLPLTKPEKVERLIDSRRMKENLLTNSSYTNLDNPDIFYSGYYEYFTENYRSYFNQLARTLIDEGDIDSAKDVMRASLNYFPDESIPMGLASGISSVTNLLTIHEKDTANQLSERLVARAVDWLDYAYENDTLNEIEARRHMVLISELSKVFHAYGDYDRAKIYQNILKNYSS